VADAVCRLPILLQRVDANLASGRDIWVKYFGCKPAFWRSSGELVGELELNMEVTPSIGCTLRSLDNSCHVQHIILVGDDTNPFWRTVFEFNQFSHQATHGGGRDRHDSDM